MKNVSMFELINNESLDETNATLSKLNDTASKIDKTFKDFNTTQKEFAKTASDVSGSMGGSGGGDGGGTHPHSSDALAYSKNVSNMQWSQIIDSFAGGLSKTIDQLGSLALRAQDFNVALTNISYRMLNPGAQMSELYDQGGMLKIVDRMNNAKNTPWQGIQLDEAIHGTETFLQYGKYRNQTEGKLGEQNIEKALQAGKVGARGRGLDFNSALETSMKYNVAGVDMAHIQEFNLQLGAVARIGAMSNKEILNVDNAIRKLAYTFRISGTDLQRFGMDYMEVAAKLSAVGGNPIELMGKMNQYQTGSTEGLINALILGYKPGDTSGNAEKTKAAALQMDARLKAIPEIARPFAFEGMAQGTGIQGFHYSDMESLRRYGTGGGKAGDPAKMLAEIAKNTGVYVSSADKFGGILNRVNMTQIRVGQQLLTGFSAFFDKHGEKVLKGFEMLGDHFSKHIGQFASLLAGFNLLSAATMLFYKIKGGKAFGAGLLESGLGMARFLPAVGIGLGAGFLVKKMMKDYGNYLNKDAVEKDISKSNMDAFKYEQGADSATSLNGSRLNVEGMQKYRQIAKDLRIRAFNLGMYPEGGGAPSPDVAGSGDMDEEFARSIGANYQGKNLGTVYGNGVNLKSYTDTMADEGFSEKEFNLKQRNILENILKTKYNLTIPVHGRNTGEHGTNSGHYANRKLDALGSPEQILKAIQGMEKEGLGVTSRFEYNPKLTPEQALSKYGPELMKYGAPGGKGFSGEYHLDAGFPSMQEFDMDKVSALMGDDQKFNSAGKQLNKNAMQAQAEAVAGLDITKHQPGSSDRYGKKFTLIRGGKVEGTQAGIPTAVSSTAATQTSSPHEEATAAAAQAAPFRVHDSQVNETLTNIFNAINSKNNQAPHKGVPPNSVAEYKKNVASGGIPYYISRPA